MGNGFGKTGGTRRMHDESIDIVRIEDRIFGRDGIRSERALGFEEAFVTD